MHDVSCGGLSASFVGASQDPGGYLSGIRGRVGLAHGNFAVNHMSGRPRPFHTQQGMGPQRWEGLVGRVG